MTSTLPLDRLPRPRVRNAETAPSLRWGVLGPGWIAERFVASLQAHTNQRVTAVGSRDAARAAAFAARFNIPSHHGSYQQLVEDAEIDIVYVASPHPQHHACAVLAIEAGKHVLIEKPIALTHQDAADIIQRAQTNKVFCMEAVWTLFLPKFDVIRQILDAGHLGEITTLLADMGETFPSHHRIFDSNLAGGTLGDLAPYPVALATWVFGAPTTVVSAGQRHPRGVDAQIAAILTDDHGHQALLSTSIIANTPTTATIAGTHGTIEINGPFYQPGDFTFRPHPDLGPPLTWTEPPVAHDALHYQATEMAHLIGQEALESPTRLLAASLIDVGIIEELRSQTSSH